MVHGGVDTVSKSASNNFDGGSYFVLVRGSGEVKASLGFMLMEKHDLKSKIGGAVSGTN